MSRAAPQTTTTLDTPPLDAEDDPLLATADPELRGSRPTYIFNTSLGFEGGHYLENDQYDQGPYLALRYIPLVDSDVEWDYQVEINAANLVGLSTGYRFYCCEKDPYNPYLRLSANLFLEGAGELAGILEIRRWRARAAVGLGESFTSEFGVGMAVTGTDLFAQFGYNFYF